jgi:hypothetical protein
VLGIKPQPGFAPAGRLSGFGKWRPDDSQHLAFGSQGPEMRRTRVNLFSSLASVAIFQVISVKRWRARVRVWSGLKPLRIFQDDHLALASIHRSAYDTVDLKYLILHPPNLMMRRFYFFDTQNLKI